jgi:hypothetical protein
MNGTSPEKVRLKKAIMVFLYAALTSDIEAMAQDVGVKRITSFEGTCRMQLVQGMLPCDSKVAWVELRNGRSFLTFTKGGYSFTVSGGNDRQPNLENYFQSIDTLRMLKSGNLEAEDSGMEGECHHRLGKDAKRFFFIRCDVYNRSKGHIYKFHLENIRNFQTQPLG